MNIYSSPLGLVELVRTLKTGDVTSEWMTVVAAMDEAFFSALNGNEVVSARINCNGVSGGTCGLSGSALIAEYSSIAHNWL